MPLGLFMLGWLLYSVGFIWFLISSEPKKANDPAPDDPADPTLFPFYVALIGGPAVYVFGALHAMLSGAAGAVLGIFVAFLNVVYFSSVSWIAYDKGLNVTNGSSTPGVDRPAWLMFEGTLFALVCWCIVLVLSVFYKNPNNRLNPRHSQDCLTMCTRATQTADSKRPFPGVARLLSVPFLILSMIGWCIFVAGYHQWNTDHEKNSTVQVFDDHINPVVICALIIGPLLYLASLLHAGCSGRTSTMGVFTTILHALYIVSNGFIITHLSQLFICNAKNVSSNTCTEQYNIDYMLGGCVASVLFWTIVFALRPFYQDFRGTGGASSSSSSSRVRGNADNNLRESTPGSPPPDYGTATAATHPAAQVREAGDQDTRPLLAESAQ